MSAIYYLKQKGYSIPEPESCEGVSSQAIIDLINKYNIKAEKTDHLTDIDFLELLGYYPRSMTDHKMTSKFHLLIALIYQEGQPSQQDLIDFEAEKQEFLKTHSWLTQKDKDDQLDGHYPKQIFSFDTLALMFCCSKSTIHDSIRKQGDVARQLVDDYNAKLAQRKQDYANQSNKPLPT